MGRGPVWLIRVVGRRQLVPGGLLTGLRGVGSRLTGPAGPAGAGPVSSGRCPGAANAGRKSWRRYQESQERRTMSQSCAIWRGDIGAYIVGALDLDACARVRRHLRVCDSCRADYRDLAPVRDWLGWLVPEGGPPADHVRGRPAL